jgi:hypothetical protein
MRKFPMALLTALIASACTAAPDAQTPTQQPVETLAAAPEGAGFIESVEYAGTGCEGGTTTGLSPDKQVATSIFSGFVAAAGEGTPPDEASRNCLLILQVHVPPGWSYSLESVDYRGFASLERDVTASRQSVYVISGSPVHATPAVRWNGVVDEEYNQADVGPEAPGLWSPCGGGQVLWIATQTQVNNGGRDSRSGLLTIDTIDTELQWRRCQ